MNNRLIVIEGADGSGKATQANLLRERFEREGQDVAMFAFPQYESGLSGKLLGELLRGDHGDFMSLSPYVSSLPYILDRVSAKKELDSVLETGKVVICDRYSPSNLAHQSAKIASQAEKDEFIAFCEQLEYDELQLPRPTTVIYLSVPTHVSTRLVEDKGARGWLRGMVGKKDLAERNTDHQAKARAMYEKFAIERPEWHLIDCTKSGEMRTREAIHEDIWHIVQ